jgi:hypothetical protein
VGVWPEMEFFRGHCAVFGFCPTLFFYFGRQISKLELFAITIPLVVLIGWVGFAPIRKEGKRILCETEYAKQKGFTPENFRLFIFEKKTAAS